MQHLHRTGGKKEKHLYTKEPSARRQSIEFLVHLCVSRVCLKDLVYFADVSTLDCQSVYTIFFLMLEFHYGININFVYGEFIPQRKRAMENSTGVFFFSVYNGAGLNFTIIIMPSTIRITVQRIIFSVRFIGSTR